MSDNGNCPIWGTQAKIDFRPGGWALVDSPRAGGKYVIKDIAVVLLERFDEHLKESLKACLTTWLIDQRRLGNPCPKIDHITIEDAKQWQVLPVPERANRLLKYVSELEQHVGDGFNCFRNEDSDEFLSMLGLDGIRDKPTCKGETKT